MQRSSARVWSHAATVPGALLLAGCVVAAAGAGAGGGIYFTQRGVESVVPVPVERAATAAGQAFEQRSEEHTSELQSQSNLVCRLLLEKKKLLHTEYRKPPERSPHSGILLLSQQSPLT